MALWVIRILFLGLCTLCGYAISQLRPELAGAPMVGSPLVGILIGFGLGGLLIALDEMLKGFSLRAFSAASFGLLLGSAIAWMIDRSQLFIYADDSSRWLIRLGMFLGFGYIGMILAMRSNKEDFYLIIPFVRFAPQNKPENLLLLDTSAIIDGRVVELIENNFLEGIVVVPRFVLKELQQIADSSDATKRARGRRGLEILSRLQRNPKNEVKIHEADFAEEPEVDAKLVRLARLLGAKLFTTDYNLGRIAELQSVRHLNVHELSNALKTTLLPGENVNLRIVREGKDKGQGIGYLNDGTMVVVNHAQALIGQQVQVQVISSRQTGAGVIIFADLVAPVAA
jgi:uncharacterized protein YacL